MSKALLSWRGNSLNAFSWTYKFKENQIGVGVDQQLFAAFDGQPSLRWSSTLLQPLSSTAVNAQSSAAPAAPGAVFWFGFCFFNVY